MPAARCGIGFGGPVIFKEQRVALSTHVGGWRDFHLTDWVHDLLGIPAIMDNDANAGALGEARFGAGRGHSPLFYMTLSTGIGGGIYDDGRIWRGADSYGGEIGHLTIRPDGPACLCGWHGCFERMCSGLWLARDYGKTAEELLRDPAFVERYVVDLALGLKACIMLLNPARIVIGGGISKAGDRLFEPLRARTAPANHGLVRRAHRCGPRGAGRRQRPLWRAGAGGGCWVLVIAGRAPHDQVALPGGSGDPPQDWSPAPRC